MTQLIHDKEFASETVEHLKAFLEYTYSKGLDSTKGLCAELYHYLIKERDISDKRVTDCLDLLNHLFTANDYSNFAAPFNDGHMSLFFKERDYRKVHLNPERIKFVEHYANNPLTTLVDRS